MCIEGDVEIISVILNYSFDKFDSVIVFSLKIGCNVIYFVGKFIYIVLW